MATQLDTVTLYSDAVDQRLASEQLGASTMQRLKLKKLGPIRTHLVSTEFCRTMIKVNALMLYSLILLSMTIP